MTSLCRLDPGALRANTPIPIPNKTASAFWFQPRGLPKKSTTSNWCPSCRRYHFWGTFLGPWLGPSHALHFPVPSQVSPQCHDLTHGLSRHLWIDPAEDRHLDCREGKHQRQSQGVRGGLGHGWNWWVRCATCLFMVIEVNNCQFAW